MQSPEDLCVLGGDATNVGKGLFPDVLPTRLNEDAGFGSAGHRHPSLGGCETTRERRGLAPSAATSATVAGAQELRLAVELAEVAAAGHA